MSKKLVPERQPINTSYTAERVVEYIAAAYDETVSVDKVDTTLSCGQEALEKLGYEYEEGDGYFESDPRVKHEFTVGDIVMTLKGGVGVVIELNEFGDCALVDIPGWKDVEYNAWHEPETLKVLFSSVKEWEKTMENFNE